MTRPGLVIIADKGYVSAELDAFLAARGVALLRPSYRNRTPRPGERLLKPVSSPAGLTNSSPRIVIPYTASSGGPAAGGAGATRSR